MKKMIDRIETLITENTLKVWTQIVSLTKLNDKIGRRKNKENFFLVSKLNFLISNTKKTKNYHQRNIFLGTNAAASTAIRIFESNHVSKRKK